jgi:geranylgeranyl diphosphate synthase type I
VRRIIDSSGAAAQVEAVIEELATHAVRSLDRAGLDEHATEVLRGLAASVTRRTV